MPNIHLAYGYLHSQVIDGRIQTSFPGESDEVSIAGKKLPYTPEHTLTVSFEKNLFNKINSRLDFKYVGSAYSDFENIEYSRAKETNQFWSELYFLTSGLER